MYNLVWQSVMCRREGLATDNPAWKAYVRAGYTRNPESARVDSTRLLKSAPEIIERVRKFQRDAAKQTGETVEKFTGELNSILQDAREDRAHNAAVSAIGLKTKVLGLVVDRTEVGNPGAFSGDYSRVTNTDPEVFADHLRTFIDHAPDHLRPPDIDPQTITEDQISRLRWRSTGVTVMR